MRSMFGKQLSETREMTRRDRLPFLLALVLIVGSCGNRSEFAIEPGPSFSLASLQAGVAPLEVRDEAGLVEDISFFYLNENEEREAIELQDSGQPAPQVWTNDRRGFDHVFLTTAPTCYVAPLVVVSGDREDVEVIVVAPQMSDDADCDLASFDAQIGINWVGEVPAEITWTSIG